MQTFTEMPYGYRWLTSEEITEAGSRPEKRWCGWMRHIALVTPQDDSKTAGYVRPWDCMIEFGMDHDHDPEVCEYNLFLMDGDSDAPVQYNAVDDFGQVYVDA